jgi:S1-C subfamily serine protease
MGNNKNHNIFVIILAFIFGLAGGITGFLVFKLYFSQDLFGIPLGSEIDFSYGGYKGQSIIIKEPKKVVVDQDTKAAETISSAKNSLVGIFAKKEAAQKNSAGKFNPDNYYQTNKEVAQGFILTSDGWILTNFKPDNLNYIVITEDRKIYSIDKIVEDILTPFYFLHVSTKDFPVRRISGRGETQNGQLVLAINWDGSAKFDSVSASSDRGESIFYSSEILSGQIKLADPLEDKFKNSFIFNLSGDIVGLTDKNGLIRPLSQFNSAISSLLKNKIVKRPNLGLNYVDLSKLAGESLSAFFVNSISSAKGALIYKNENSPAVIKGGAANQAGLREGDIIVAVEGKEISGSDALEEIIQDYAAGETVNIVYLRDKEKMEVDVKLGEIVKEKTLK